MKVGELIKVLADYCPDTPIMALDGNLLTSHLYYTRYGEDTVVFPEINDGEGGDPDTLYLVTD